MYGTSSSNEKLARVKNLGLQHSINYKESDYEEVIKELSRGEGVDAVFEMLGVQDVVAKSLGSSNPYNMVRATFDGLKHQENPRGVAARRGKKYGDIVARRRDGSAAEADATGEV